MRRLAALGILLVASCEFCAAAPEQWTEARNEHFVVLTDAGEKQARNLVDQFERIRWMFHTQFPDAQVDPVEPIIVMAARNTRTFQAFEPAAYLEKGQLKLAGVFLRVYDKNYVLLRLDAAFDHPFAPVYHEYTHFVLSGDAQWMPLWLNEGLAEFFQNTAIQDKNVWLGGPCDENIEYLIGRQLIPLKTLFKIDRASPYYHEEQKGSVFYAESWVLTQYLEFADRTEGTHRINDYLDRMRAHEDAVAAAEEAFGDLILLENSLRVYIRAGKYGRFALSSAAARIDGTAFKVRSVTQVEADAARADVLLAVKRENEARALLEAILKADPDNAQAHDTLGTLEYHAGHDDAALHQYREAIRLSSQNYFVYFNFANLAMLDEKAWDHPEIESSLRTAVRLNPRYYPASEFLATLLSSMNRFSEATAVLEEAERAAATPADAARIRARLARLEQTAEERKQLATRSEQAIAPASAPTLVTYDSEPKHPTVPADGPKHQASGIIRGVQCTYPAIIEFRIDGRGKSVTLYSNDYTAIDYTVLGFLPQGNLHPCDELEGMQTRVRYVESSDKTVDGQVIAMELRK
jgi:tetratricopeptide (TPR) repeat protein